MSAYELYQDYRIEVMEVLSVSHQIETGDNGVKTLWVEETRKNSQEDCHMHEEAILENGKWKWNLDTDWEDSSSFEAYYNKEFSDSILQFLNENPHPDLG